MAKKIVSKPDYTGMGIGFTTNKPKTISMDFVYPNRQKYIGGAPTLVGGVAGKIGSVAKAYKGLNYFRPTEGMMYRGIGEAGVKDALSTRVFRANPNPPKVTIRTGSGLFDMDMKYQGAYFSPSFRRATKYAKDYVAEVPKNATDFIQRYSTKDWSQMARENIPIEKGRILRKNFLSGYKEIPVKKNGGLIMKTAVQSLKCGGKKKKKMADGGSVKPTVPYEQLGKMAGDYADNLITSQIDPYTDNRENPNDYLKQRDRLTTTGSIAKNTLKGAGIGAAIGSVVPGLGTVVGGAIGAGVGATSTGIKSLFTSKSKKRERVEDQENWAGAWTSEYVDRSLKTGYATGGKKGGKIKGDGGPKSDSIEKKVEDGSFIVPSENAATAMEYGKQYLHWKGDETASRKYPGTEVALSNGEVLFTPEESDILRYHGIDLNRLAPQAEPGNKMATGGEKGLPSKLSGITKKEDFVTAYLDEYSGTTEEDALTAWDGIQVPTSTTKGSTETPKSTFQKMMDFAPEIAGALQVGAAATGLIKAGRMPDINVSEALRSITNEARQESQYGLEPGTKSAMLNQAEKARRDVTNAVVTRGGSAAEVMSNLQGLLTTTTDKKFDIELADASEKVRKKGIYYGLKSKVGDQQFDISKLARQDWLQMQEVNSGLLSAGISNIVGARKLKMELDTMKKIGKSSADFSSLTT